MSQPSGQVLGHAADAEPVRVHARAADGLDDVEDPLAVGEHVEDRRHRAQVLGEGAVPDQMAGDAEQLRHHDADDLGAVGNLDAGQLLHRQHVGQVVHHAAQVVDAIGVGDVRVPGLPLGHLLGAAVVVADVRHGVDDLLAVELQHDPQHAVRAGVLRTDVQEHEIGRHRGDGSCPTPRGGTEGRLPPAAACSSGS